MYLVKAHWDPEARLWHGDSFDLPGLSVQAATMEDLIADVRDRVLDLLPPEQSAGSSAPPISISFVASRSERVARPY